MEIRLKTEQEFIKLIETLKIGGQKASVHCESAVKMKKDNPFFENGVHPTKKFHINFNWGTDYAKQMIKKYGEDYEFTPKKNNISIVKNVLQYNTNTHNYLFCCNPNDIKSDGRFIEEREATAEEIKTMEKWAYARSDNKPEYMTISLQNVRYINANNCNYIVDF